MTGQNALIWMEIESDEAKIIAYIIPHFYGSEFVNGRLTQSLI